MGTKRLRIITISASTGGTEEINIFFDHTPVGEDSFVRVQHLSPDFESRVPGLPVRHSQPLFNEVNNNMETENNQVYTIPGNMYLNLRMGKFSLAEKLGKDGSLITKNIFFTSLTKDRNEKTIDVIFYGINRGSSLGVAFKHQAGDLMRFQNTYPTPFKGIFQPVSNNFEKALLAEQLNEWVWRECGFSGICVDEQHHIIHSFGDLSLYLNKKMLTFKLDELLPEHLSKVVRAAISKSVKNLEQVNISRIPVEKEEQHYRVSVQVKPMMITKTGQQVVMLLFRKERNGKVPGKTHESFKLEEYTRAYVAELEAAHNHQEADPKVMQSFNQGLLAVNEELQGINEEQEFFNEEIQTMNCEHLATIEELSLLYYDLDNYYRSNVNGQLYVDDELLLKRFTPSAFEPFKLEKSDLSQPISRIITKIGFETLIEDIIKVISEGNIITQEIQLNNEKWYQVAIMPYIRQADQRQDGAIITFHDITDLKKEYGKLNEINKNLMQTNAELDNFVYTASHDLTSPLNNIEGLIGLLLEKTDGKATEEVQLIQLMNTCVGKLKAIIKDLGEIGKADSEKHNRLDKTNLKELLEDIRLSMLDQVTSSNATIITDFKIEEIHFSKKNLRSIFYNLLSNAIKYKSPERDPEIRITAEINQNFLVLTFSDNGMGIKEDQLKNIFTLYHRLGQQVEGHGIGLYLVKKIMDASGGTIETSSIYNTGTTFKLTFRP